MEGARETITKTLSARWKYFHMIGFYSN